MTDKVYSFLGLSAKAGKIISGEDASERALKSNKAKLVIVAEDASDNTAKSFEDMCCYRKINLRRFGRKEMIGKSIGKEMRTVVAITDKGFANRLIELIDGNRQEHGGV
jgi:ribosomal protein L7Ae-like RNA K-turn-binding protein